jgi:hypothetical protein
MRGLLALHLWSVRAIAQSFREKKTNALHESTRSGRVTTDPEIGQNGLLPIPAIEPELATPTASGFEERDELLASVDNKRQRLPVIHPQSRSPLNEGRKRKQISERALHEQKCEGGFTVDLPSNHAMHLFCFRRCRFYTVWKGVDPSLDHPSFMPIQGGGWKIITNKHRLILQQTVS